MSTKNTIISMGVLVLIIIAVVLVMVLTGGAAKSDPAVDALAQCLASKNVTMYGAYWCPHCQAQKKLFGSSFQYVPYVECTQDVAKCTAMNIEGYPTWIFSDGSRVEREMSFSDFFNKTGCQLSYSTSTAPTSTATIQ
jgi:thiol-disulfide isomerase/thioredoxin